MSTTIISTVKDIHRLTTISEILAWAAEPDLIADRALRLMEVGEITEDKIGEGFKAFLTHAFGEKQGYDFLLPYYTPHYVSKTPNRQEIGFAEFFNRYLKDIRPKASGTAQNKRSKFARFSDFFDARDYFYITNALQGDFLHEDLRINMLVVKLAFSELFPNT